MLWDGLWRAYSPALASLAGADALSSALDWACDPLHAPADLLAAALESKAPPWLDYEPWRPSKASAADREMHLPRTRPLRAAQGLWPAASDALVQPCEALQQAMTVRHAVIVLGPAGCGKTSCYRTLRRARELSAAPPTEGAYTALTERGSLEGLQRRPTVRVASRVTPDPIAA